MANMDIPPLPEGADDEDWFGDGSAFNSQAELASALLNVDGTAMPPPEPEVAPLESVVPAAEDADAGTPDEPGAALQEFAAVPEEFEAAPQKPASNGQVNGHFDFVDPRDPSGALLEPASPPPPAPPPPVLPTWSVRIPGVQLLPARQPGRTGWSMDNSVRILRQTEELVARLREQAVVAAFAAAARAMHGEDS
ncbi:MAG TPA: hypothetical protein VNY76_00630 [Candidatus Acidoferrales bacterium]|nr:hypothetical protein [Candidatus Acidoferrales bacterium]